MIDLPYFIQINRNHRIFRRYGTLKIHCSKVTFHSDVPYVCSENAVLTVICAVVRLWC